MPESEHFILQPLAKGIIACIHKPGGGAFSNAGILDLGARSLVLDTFQTLAAGRSLRATAEALFARPVEMVALTHGHMDHWVGACAFDAGTSLVAGSSVRDACVKWAAILLEDYQNAALWDEMLQGTRQALENEKDERLRAEHEHMLSFFQYVIAERNLVQPRTPERTFDGTLTLTGSSRTVELRSLDAGHSEEDCVLLLPEEGIAFIGDIGFFDTQPQLNVFDPALHRRQIDFFLGAPFQTLVPGHGPVGGREQLILQLDYMDALEQRVGDVARRGGSLQEALQVSLPEPFNRWLTGGMNLFADNVRTLFKRLGGEVPEGE